MKMFLLVFVQYLVLAGGVDVGNGMTVEISVDGRFTSENSLVNYVETETYNIERGEFAELSRLISKHRCKKKTSLKDVEVVEFYPFKNGVIEKKNYKGLLKVDLKDCKRK